MHALLKSLCLAAALFSLSTMVQANNIDTILPDSSAIKWTDLSTSPGAKLAVLVGDPKKKGFFVVRVKFPANYTVQPHHHVIDQYETVISGTYYLGTGDKVDTDKGVELAAGSFAKIPANSEHYGWTKEETVLQISGIGPWGIVYQKAQDTHS
jgi:quercetin dioxygenase-like cupin family protein